MNQQPLTPKPPRLSAVEMTELVMPQDVNGLNGLFGGRVLEWADKASAMAAIRHAERPCVTASFDSVDFLAPVHMGEACVLKARVTWAGRSSIEVKVDIYALRLMSGEQRLTTTAFVTFVALDPAIGKPTPVAPVVPETDEERRLFEGAAIRRQERLARRKAHEAEANQATV